ncbi:hypothetical protein EVAR_100203_1 [Eumeta japonica]|uniref:Uncharacterized protein n=1 Tax=Eumeta variegata TaxID=151549 RepID=A0A4C1TG32_EUMVA|nr:hypothetical protein EVAR_100203_1 [Eumeta japonica]
MFRIVLKQVTLLQIEVSVHRSIFKYVPSTIGLYTPVHPGRALAKYIHQAELEPYRVATLRHEYTTDPGDSGEGSDMWQAAVAFRLVSESSGDLLFPSSIGYAILSRDQQWIHSSCDG